MTLIPSHFDGINRRLEAEGEAAKSFGHGLNRGQIREAFVREFLEQNISSFWEIGTGEIIHDESDPKEARNQIDVIIHNRKFPKLSFATGIDLFFVESVSSFIEVKSKLKKDDLRNTAATTKTIKSQVDLPPQNFSPVSIVKTPRPYSFVFAYDGPKRITTVLNWLKEISEEDDYRLQDLQKTPPDERFFFNHHFIDGVFILGRGFVYVDSLPFQSQIDKAIKTGEKVSPNSVWVWGDKSEMLIMWTILNRVNSHLLWSEADLLRYIGAVEFELEDA